MWKPVAHVEAVHAVEALPVQAVHESPVILVIVFTIAAHKVQPRFVVVVQAVDSYRVEEQEEAHVEHRSDNFVQVEPT